MSLSSLPDGRVPVLLSAHASDLVGQDAAAILAYLDRHVSVTDVGVVSSTLLRTRRLRRHRAVIRAADRAELSDGLRALADGVEHPLVTRSSANPSQPGNSTPRVAFVFPGQGSQWPAMGVEAYHHLPDYRAEADECAAAFAAAGAESPMPYLLADPGSVAPTSFSQVQIQGAQFVHGVALAKVWRSCGVQPDLTVGHSLGEIGAAYVAGSITLSEAVAVVVARATVLDGLTGPYRVAVLGIAPDDAQAVIDETPGWLELSVVNSHASVAVSGDADAVAAAVRTVTERGFFAKEIDVGFPAHTTALDSVRSHFASLLPSARFAETPVQFVGSTTADVVASGTDFDDYWFTNLRSTVRFDEAVRTAVGRGAGIFVELSAHPALLFAMADLLDDAVEMARVPAVMVGSGRRDEVLTDQLSANLAAVALADPGYRWVDLLAESRETLRDFPFAVMRAEHHWARPEPLPPIAGLTVAVERWEPMPTRVVADGTHRAAVVDLDAGGRLAETLRTAIDRRCALSAELVDADLLVVIAPRIDTWEAVGAAEDLSRRIGEGLLGYADAITPNHRDVWLVTVGGERVGETDPAPLPAAAALAAMHRSVGFEHPEQSFHQLDLPTADLDEAAAAAAVTLLLGHNGDVALRDNGSGPTPFRRTTADDTSAPSSWSAASGHLDDVVITGGTGAVGLHYARHLAERGARRIVLLSRSGADSDRLAELVEAHDVEIHAPLCDVTDAAQVAATAAEFAGDGASLLIHAAGAATIAPSSALTADSARETFAAKVAGLHHVVAAWPLRPDARILLCSSVSALWGGHGHAVYAAANRLLDVMADQLRADGRHCTAVRWGLWPGTGIIDGDEIARVQRSGLRAMDPELAVEESLRDRAADPLVFAADPERLRTFLGGDPRDDTSGDTRVDAVEIGDLDARGAVRVALGRVLTVPDPTGLDLDASLLDLGVDSLLALDLRKKLKQATGQTVPLATILGGVTGTELIEHLETTEKKALIRD